MGWFSVTSTICAENVGNISFAFRVHGVETLHDFLSVLSSKGGVIGERFKVISARGGSRRELVNPEETLLTASGIAKVSLFRNVDLYAVRE